MIVAYSFLLAYETNPTLVTPEPGMNTAEALLYMLRQGQKPTSFESDILDLALLLHAEHGGGNIHRLPLMWLHHRGLIFMELP